jgi:ribosomal protein S6--L-glutamate ligase
MTDDSFTLGVWRYSRDAMMKIGLLAWEMDEPESLVIRAQGELMGHSVVLFTLEHVSMRWDARGFETTIHGHPLSSFSIIVSRYQYNEDTWIDDFEKLSILAASKTVPFFDSLDAYWGAMSKLYNIHVLGRAGLPVPSSAYSRSVDEILDWHQSRGRLVVKPSRSGLGTDIFLVEDSSDETRRKIEGVLSKYRGVILQEFIPHPEGDMRINVIGEEVVFSFKRVRQPGMDFRSNVTLGAKAVAFEPDEALKCLCLAATRALGLSMAGVDVAQHDGRFYIFEVNEVPGWYFLDDKDQALLGSKIIQLAEAVVERRARERSLAA